MNKLFASMLVAAVWGSSPAIAAGFSQDNATSTQMSVSVKVIAGCKTEFEDHTSPVVIPVDFNPAKDLLKLGTSSYAIECNRGASAKMSVASATFAGVNAYHPNGSKQGEPDIIVSGLDKDDKLVFTSTNGKQVKTVDYALRFTTAPGFIDQLEAGQAYDAIVRWNIAYDYKS